MNSEFEHLCGLEPEEMTIRAELTATEADVVVARALDICLASRVPESPCFPVPERPIAAERMALLREGIEKFTDGAEEEAFTRQDPRAASGELCQCTTCFCSKPSRSQRSSARLCCMGEGVDCTGVGDSVFGAHCKCEMRGCELQACGLHLDFAHAGKSELRRMLLCTHRAYGGGAKVRRLLNKFGFAGSVLEGAMTEWVALRHAMSLPEGSYDPMVLKNNRTHEVAIGRTGVQGGGHPGVTVASAPFEAAKELHVAATPTYSIETHPPNVAVTVCLPGLTSAEVSLEVSARQLSARSLVLKHQYSLDVDLPVRVDPQSSRAKWVKRKEQLVIHLRQGE